MSLEQHGSGDDYIGRCGGGDRVGEGHDDSDDDDDVLGKLLMKDFECRFFGCLNRKV